MERDNHNRTQDVTIRPEKMVNGDKEMKTKTTQIQAKIDFLNEIFPAAGYYLAGDSGQTAIKYNNGARELCRGTKTAVYYQLSCATEVLYKFQKENDLLKNRGQNEDNGSC